MLGVAEMRLTGKAKAHMRHANPVPSPETGRCNDHRESEYPVGEIPAEEVPCPVIDG